MKIRLSYRDVQSDTKDVNRDHSQTQENNPVENKGLLKLKPQIDVNIKLDKDRVDVGEEITMGLNSRNLMNIGK